jgi:hypothetical protein
MSQRRKLARALKRVRDAEPIPGGATVSLEVREGVHTIIIDESTASARMTAEQRAYFERAFARQGARVAFLPADDAPPVDT